MNSGGKMNNKGFTLIETMVSVLLIMIAVLYVTSVIIHSLRYSKKNKDIFYIHQKADNIKNQLLSNQFNSIELSEGETKREEDGYEIFCKIVNKSESLKEISLIIKKMGLNKKYYFIKSKYIN